MDKKTREKIEKYVKLFRWTPKDFYWHHAYEVRRLALLIQRRIGGDKEVIEVSSLLHDIGKARLLAPGHEKISAKLTKTILNKSDFDKSKIKAATDCIKYKTPASLETKILRSADSMALITDKWGGREWYFKSVLKNKKNILKELKKSYTEIGFDFAKQLVRKRYQKLNRNL